MFKLPAPSDFGPSAFLRASGFGFRICTLLAALLLLAACRSVPAEKPLQRFEFSHPAMGTLITITLYAPDSAAAKAAAAAAFQAHRRAGRHHERLPGGQRTDAAL